MNEQNNNNEQPNQDQQQPYQAERAESVPPAQSVPAYQPYQSETQSPEPYQGEAQQPVQTYETYQSEPQPYQTYQEPPAPPKKKSKWWIWLIVAGVVVIGAVAALFFLTDVGASLFGEKRPGNQAAWKAYDYFNTMEDKLKAIMSETHKEFSDRTDTEPFEADGEFEIKSDLIDGIGYGIESIGGDFTVKYDMTDLGIQIDKLLGFFSADIYLIEDELVIGFMDEGYATEIDTNTDVDLKEAMPLIDRLDALNTISSSEAKDLLERLMSELAPAIPDELTEIETIDVYSPLEDDEVEMKAYTTTLEDDDMQQVLMQFGENLEQNEELLDDLQDLFDTITKTTGEDIDIDDIIESMIEMDEDDSFEDFTFAFSVYEYKGETVGMSFLVEDDENTDMEMFIISEYTSNAVYTSIIVNFDGDELMNFYMETEYSEEDVDTDVVFTINTPEDEYIDSDEVSFSVKGSTTVEKDDSTEYEFSGDYKIRMNFGDTFSMNTGEDETMEFDFEFEGECEFGDELGTLKEDDDWNEIYDLEWGDIEDLMRTIFNLTGTGDFGIGDIGDF